MNRNELHQKLTELALKCTHSFCYNDYIECPTGVCPHCGSNDLMRLMPGIGCEYGTDWVIEEILEQELEPANTEELFEEFVRECYADTVKVGWAELDTTETLKTMDSISWRMAQADWESEEIEEERFYTPDNGTTVYQTPDVERLIEKLL